MPAHRHKEGIIVEIRGGAASVIPPGRYEITRLMPPTVGGGQTYKWESAANSITIIFNKEGKVLRIDYSLNAKNNFFFRWADDANHEVVLRAGPHGDPADGLGRELLLRVRGTRGQDHLRANVTASQFEGMSRIEQHRLVYAAVRPYLDDGSIHALALQTSPLATEAP